MRFVYILRCKDKTLYTGITNDIDKRVLAHNTSKTWAKYTKSRRPVMLVWKKRVTTKVIAMKLEYKMKRLAKVKKEELVNKKIKKKKIKK